MNIPTRKSLENIEFSRLFLILSAYDFWAFLKKFLKKDFQQCIVIRLFRCFNLPALHKNALEYELPQSIFVYLDVLENNPFND